MHFSKTANAFVIFSKCICQKQQMQNIAIFLMFFKVFNKKEELPGWTAHFFMNVSMMCLYWSRHSFSVTALRSICPARILTVPSSKSLCYRTAFYPCFLQFAILQGRRTLSPGKGVKHSWEHYHFHNVQLLRSTVRMVYPLPRCYPMIGDFTDFARFFNDFFKSKPQMFTGSTGHCYRCRHGFPLPGRRLSPACMAFRHRPYS